MEGQTAQRSIPEDVVDDPLAPLRLSPLAQTRDFWKRYDRLADIHDKRLMSNLNENLDVLLIFAALFSAINTAFISITMLDLSPRPSDETNALLRLMLMRADNNTLPPAGLASPFSPNATSVIVNCVLFASLSCSLLAAVGAMMAKEWLQSFDRSGQTGPLEGQGEFRQRKFNGFEQWHLEAVIKFLPNLLLLSVNFFFAGISLFLFPINTAVTGTVIAFWGLGAILLGTAIVAGTISPLCPYQSGASNALRRIPDVLVRCWDLLSRTIVHPILRTALERTSKISDLATRFWIWLHRLICRSTVTSMDLPEHSPTIPFRHSGSLIHRGVKPLAELVVHAIHLGTKLFHTILLYVARRHKSQQMTTHSSGPTQSAATNEQIVGAQAACWLLQTTSSRGDQVAAARFLRSLNREACTLVLENSGNWRRLFSLTRDALDVWDSQPSEGNRQVAEILGMSLCHVPLPFPEDAAPGGKSFDPIRLYGRGSFSVAFLQALKLARAKYEEENEECIFHLAFLSTLLSRGQIIKEYQLSNLPKLFIVDKNPRPRIADNLLAMWAFGAWYVGASNVGRKRRAYIFHKAEELMEIGGNEDWLIKKLSRAIWWSSEVLQSAQGELSLEINAARGYFGCLRRARELVRQSPKRILYPGDLGVARLIRNYLDPMTISDSRQTSVEFVKLSIEAVLGLRDFIDANPSPDDFSAIGSLQSEQLLDRHFVKAVADILLDDPKVPDDWMISSIKPSIIKILVWVWRNMSDVTMSNWETREIFLSSCRLLAPLEKEVEYSRSGKPGPDDKPLTHDDLKRIIEFIEYIRKGRNKSEFISRSADVGINRLYAHFDLRLDWEYEMIDSWEPRTLCCRSSHFGDDLL